HSDFGAPRSLGFRRTLTTIATAHCALLNRSISSVYSSIFCLSAHNHFILPTCFTSAASHLALTSDRSLAA
ncbi:uncharacterized protein EI90DRAFT_3159187, partial [Cantharellus anzutake]|uniref:uncharacterized protein n=1 Tax=Cantharellus anzutake TaxID=1750568 RepID=UPI0019062CE2